LTDMTKQSYQCSVPKSIDPGDALLYSIRALPAPGIDHPSVSTTAGASAARLS
jgi:hypothetical protein